MKQFSDHEHRTHTVIQQNIPQDHGGNQPGKDDIDTVRHETPRVLAGTLCKARTDDAVKPAKSTGRGIVIGGGLITLAAAKRDLER